MIKNNITEIIHFSLFIIHYL